MSELERVLNTPKNEGRFIGDLMDKRNTWPHEDAMSRCIICCRRVKSGAAVVYLDTEDRMTLQGSPYTVGPECERKLP